MNEDELAVAYLKEAIDGMRALKDLADKSIAQVDDEDLHRQLDDEANSIAVVMRHIGGNIRSRWTDFLTTDGEKPNRERDLEFEPPPARDRAAILSDWERAWQVLFATLSSLAPSDLMKTVTIRGEPHTVLRAIERQSRHYASHVGQIVLMAKHWRGGAWKTLSIPRGRSKDYQGPVRA
jgi:hypothetical protein